MFEFVASRSCPTRGTSEARDAVLTASRIEPPVRDYHINVFWSEEDAGYIADIPDLNACSTVGQTPAEALAGVEQAKTAWLDSARAAGKPIPPPRYRPAIYRST